MQIFDAHCHLQDERIAGATDELLSRAHEAGIERLMCCGTSEADWGDVLSLSEKHAAVVPSFGLHPWFVADRSPDWLERLRE